MDVHLDGLFRHNDTYDYDDYVYKEDVESRDGKVAIPILYSLVLVVGLLGNGLVLAALALKRRSWTISDTFVLHLSLADVLLLASLPFSAAQASQHCGWCFAGFLCKITEAVFNINSYCGILLLVCISLDRYVSSFHAGRLYSRKRPALAPVSCAAVWLGSLVLSVPDWVFVVAGKDAAHESPLCVHKYSPSHADWKLTSRLLHHALGFLLPAATLVACWARVLLRGSQKPRSVVLALSLVGVFLLCWVPYNVTLIVDTATSHSVQESNGSSGRHPGGATQAALAVTSVLGRVHACLRPLLYLGLSASFRRRILGLRRGAAAAGESESWTWELRVGEEVLPDRSRDAGDAEELKQMTSVDHQGPSAQC